VISVQLRVVFEGSLHTAVTTLPEWAIWAVWGGLAMLAAVRTLYPQRWKMMNWAVTDYRLVSQLHRQGQLVFDMGWVLLFLAATTFAVLGLGQALAQLSGVNFSMELAWRMVCFWCLIWGVRALFLRGVNEVSEGGLPAREYSASHFLTGQVFAILAAPLGLMAWYISGSAGQILSWACLAVWTAGWLLRIGRLTLLVPGVRARPFLMIAYLCGLEMLPVLVLIEAWNW